MGWSLAGCLDEAGRQALALASPSDADPLRLDLPPDGGGDDHLDPSVAALLGSLYLLSELELLDVVTSAELLATERWTLDVRDRATVGALDTFARSMARWPNADSRSRLYSRLFGTAHPDHRVTTSSMAPLNDQFEELLVGYCHAVTAFVQPTAPYSSRMSVGLRTAGTRLRSNLATRQYGNTTIVAPALIEQLRAALDLLAGPGIGTLFGTSGTWNVLRALHGGAGGDIGRHLDRGQAGRVMISSIGYPSVADIVDRPLVEAASLWLTATGFDLDLG